MRRAAVFWFVWPVLALAQAQPTDLSTTGSRVPAYIARAIADARPAGRGKLTWFTLHIYDARLYVPERGINADDFASQRFALELTYARRLSGRSLAESSRDEIEKLGFGSEEQRAAWLSEMTRIFPNIAAGQTLAAIHLSNSTRFYFEGEFVGAIDDAAFGQAFFAIWLDPRTSAPGLRAELLQRGTR